MATILLAGDDAALLEGLTQLLTSAGHHATVARSLAEAREVAARSAPLVAVLDHAIVGQVESLGLALAAGGAAVLYRSANRAPSVLPASVRRAVLADLTLPLERTRLLALVDRVEARARVVGRVRRDTPPETPISR